jgi:peptide/nickel transport system substrate-binding protein
VSTNVAEETAQIDGLESGQFDAISYLSAASSAALKNRPGFSVVISDTGGFLPFTMRIDKAPFSDVRVRQALRLVVDRPQMLLEVFGGYGTIGNDMFGAFDPDFAHTFPQRVQDIARAKSLLKAAGHSDLSVQLVTSTLTGGVVQAAEVFATQAAAAGVKVAVSQQDLTSYYANSFLKVPFSQDNWEYAPYLLAASQETVAGAPFNECHFDDRQYNALYAKAYASTDPAVQRDVVHEMQKIDYEYGGLIIPFFNPNIDAVGSYVKGDIPNVTGFGLNAFDLRRFWLDK